MGSTTSFSVVDRPGLDQSRPITVVGGGHLGDSFNTPGQDSLAAYGTHLGRHGLMNTPVNVLYAPARPLNPFLTPGEMGRQPANIFRRARGQDRIGGRSGPGSIASGRGRGSAGSGSVASGRGGGAAGDGGIGQGRGGAAAGGVIDGRVGDQGRGGGRGTLPVRGRSRGRAAQARLEASLQRTRDGRGWTTHGQSHLAAENEDPQESRLGLAHPRDQDTGPGDAPGDEDPLADQALNADEIDVRGGMGEGRSEDQADMMEEEKEAHEETLHALRLENEALKMENKAAQAQMQAAKFDNEAKELRRQAQVLALEKDVKMLRAQLQQYQGASVLPNP